VQRGRGRRRGHRGIPFTPAGSSCAAARRRAAHRRARSYPGPRGRTGAAHLILSDRPDELHLHTITPDGAVSRRSARSLRRRLAVRRWRVAHARRPRNADAARVAPLFTPTAGSGSPHQLTAIAVLLGGRIGGPAQAPVAMRWFVQMYLTSGLGAGGVRPTTCSSPEARRRRKARRPEGRWMRRGVAGCTLSADRGRITAAALRVAWLEADQVS
jgi:hypothetical protein